MTRLPLAAIETAVFIHNRILPDALSLLPGRMEGVAGRAQLLAIGLQESRFLSRRQLNSRGEETGPAHGFWQFEKNGGVAEVLEGAVTRPILVPVFKILRYKDLDRTACYHAIIHNDVLACIFARLLLWTVPGALPGPQEAEKGWQQYLRNWRPGKPHRETWDACFAEGWRIATEE